MTIPGWTEPQKHTCDGEMPRKVRLWVENRTEGIRRGICWWVECCSSPESGNEAAATLHGDPQAVARIWDLECSGVKPRLSKLRSENSII